MPTTPEPPSVQPFASPNPLPVAGFDLGRVGYVEEEYLLSGTAHQYALPGGQTPDGLWDAQVDGEAAFTTRLLVHRPTDPERFSGVVAVEWLNVSSGADLAVDWRFLHRELFRTGAAWVGVSVQRAGINGGGLIPGLHLKLTHPERYAALRHPGDAFSYDIFRLAGEVVRAGDLFPSPPTLLVGMGESQSALFLTTFVNAIAPLSNPFDAFLLHGRSGGGAPIEGTLRGHDNVADFDLAVTTREMSPDGHRIREDVGVPVLIAQAETDGTVLYGILSRQPDSDRIRTWEIAGAAHADAYSTVAALLDDGTLPPAVLGKLCAPVSIAGGVNMRKPINAGPQQHYVLQAGFAGLVAWAAGGDPLPSAPPLETDRLHGYIRDADGIVRGGVRTPWVDVPTIGYSGLGQEGPAFAPLYGTSEALPFFGVLMRYEWSGTKYADRFAAATREAVEAGFLLEADEEEIVGVGAATWPLWPRP